MYIFNQMFSIRKCNGYLQLDALVISLSAETLSRRPLTRQKALWQSACMRTVSRCDVAPLNICGLRRGQVESGWGREKSKHLWVQT